MWRKNVNRGPILDPEDIAILKKSRSRQNKSFETTCFAVTEMWKSSLIVSAISKTYDVIPHGFDLCKNILTLQAVALPFFPNEDSYTILNPPVAPWFFTDDLGGCDVFVATAANRNSRPMVTGTSL